MKLTKHNKAYAWAWIWFLAVAAGSGWLYIELTALAVPAMHKIPWLSYLIQAKAASWAGWLVYIVAGVLFCWRVVKVVAMQGSPFPFGININWGKMDEGNKPVRAHCPFIGNEHADVGNQDQEEFWYGAVFRTHPNSDKLMRARLQYLAVAFFGGWTLNVMESRIGFFRRTHEERAKQFRDQAHQLNHPGMGKFEKDLLSKLGRIEAQLKRP